MITIKMYGNKWRIIIGDEIWQFESLEQMQTHLMEILRMKDKFGRIHENY